MRAFGEYDLWVSAFHSNISVHEGCTRYNLFQINPFPLRYKKMEQKFFLGINITVPHKGVFRTNRN